MSLLDEIVEQTKHLTMVCPVGVKFTAQRAITAVDANVPGVLVECGVWRGGCSIAMLLAQQKTFGKIIKPVHMFDSFQGLPPAEPRDGPAALKWQQETDHNCRANLSELKGLLQLKFGFNGESHRVWDGWFSDTLLPFVRENLAEGQGSIAVLRLDCDWFWSVQFCLEMLFPYVSDRGIVILDDYYAWDGCARATHDFLSEWDTPYRIRSLPDMSAAYFVKEER